MSEAALWDRTRGKLGIFGELHRVENSCALGTPDVAYQLAGDMGANGGWIELKVCDMPVRVDHVDLTHYTIEQKLFARRWTKARGACWFFLRVGKGVKGEYYLIHGSASNKYGDFVKLAQLRKDAEVWSVGFPDVRLLLNSLTVG